MIKYDKEFKLKFVKSFEVENNSSISQIALKEQIPKQTLARWIRLYRILGERGLESNKPGVKERPINAEIEAQILQLWKEKERSKYRMYKDLKIKDINISEWSINKIYKKNKLSY